MSVLYATKLHNSFQRDSLIQLQYSFNIMKLSNITLATFKKMGHFSDLKLYIAKEIIIKY